MRFSDSPMLERMEKLSENGWPDVPGRSDKSPEDALLEALNVNPESHDRASAAAFRALAEEVIWLRQEEARLRRELTASQEMADRDALCPVFNRRAFERELNREMARAARHGVSLCLVYLDLDRFKAVNDGFGHAAGDAALKRVCDMVLSHVRQTDIVGRLGGDEFAILLVHANLDDARRKARDLAERVGRLRISGIGPGGQSVQLGASCGVIAWAGQGSAEQFIAEADEAMFRVKASHRPSDNGRTQNLTRFSPDS
ncbi:GGDEF domain-containing protein [Henriciella sp.]|uniref:GGDEF domain-containing protein n=1 Tax=Henriciella sp. TaxID=1968823 RepID=UPI0026137D27|nr:GGDEF domain-containing protein [Henriciella sp.]